MTVRALVIAEAASDAQVIRQLAERFLFDAGPQWVREHVDGAGWDGLLAFEGRDDEPCWTWVALKALVKDGRLPRRLRFDGLDPHVGRVIDACRILGHDRAVVHADAADARAGFADTLRGRSDPAVAVAAPNPATEAWVLHIAGHAAPAETAACKQAAGDRGLRDPDAVRDAVAEAPIERLRDRSDLEEFAADAVRVLGVVWTS